MVDLDKKFEERQAKLAGLPSKPAPTAEELSKMTNAEKGLAMQLAAEDQLANQLFGGDDEGVSGLDMKNVKLNSEKEYKEFGKCTADILYKGKAPYRIENFYKELGKDLPKNADSKQIKKIADHFTSLYNMKLIEEKADGAGGKGKKAKATLKGGGAKGYEMNNNAAMINDVIGTVDPNDYGDYGDEAFTKEKEEAYDFM